MRFKGNQGIPETIHPSVDQKTTRFPEPKEKDLTRYRSIEDVNEAENAEDIADPDEVGQAARDYFGRTEDDVEGGIPAELPDHNTMRHRPRT